MKVMSLSVFFLLCVFFISNVFAAPLPSLNIPFEDNSLRDYSPNMLNFNSYRGDPTFSTESKFGSGSLHLDQTGKTIVYREVSDELVIDGRTDNYVIDFWIYLLDSNYGDSDADQIFLIIGKDVNGESNIAMRLGVSKNTNGNSNPSDDYMNAWWVANVNGNFNQQLAISNSDNPLKTGEWNHIALMWNKDKGYSIAINGKFNGNNANQVWYNKDKPQVISSGGNVVLGIDWSWETFHPVYIDQFRITKGDAIWDEVNLRDGFVPPADGGELSYILFRDDFASNGQTSAGGEYTWTVPSGVTKIGIEVVGAGGGSGYATQIVGSGGGGGGGGTSRVTIDVREGDTYDINVGAGGNPVVSHQGHTAPGDGQKGGDSSVSFGNQEIVSAEGGGGGTGTYTCIKLSCNRPNSLGGVGGDGNIAKGGDGLDGASNTVILNNPDGQYSWGGSPATYPGRGGTYLDYGCNPTITGTDGKTSSLTPLTYCISNQALPESFEALNWIDLVPGGGAAGPMASATWGCNGICNWPGDAWTNGYKGAGGLVKICLGGDCEQTTVVSEDIGGNQCSANNQIIMKLSKDVNSHVEKHDGAGNYQTEVCYDDVFSETYSAGGNTVDSANPWQCGDLTNTVGNLIQNTNSHIEGPTPEHSEYNIPICYGDLSCTLRAVGDEVGSEKAVVYLSDNENAHASKTAAVDGVAYPYAIYCTSSNGPVRKTPTGNFNSVSWKNSFGTSLPLDDADDTNDDPDRTIHVNDSVSMFADTTWPSGQIKFEVYVVNKFLGVDALSPDEKVAKLIETVPADGQILSSLLKINDSMLEGQDRDLRFIAKDFEETRTITSGILKVDRYQSPPSRELDIKILSPVDGGLYFLNSPVEFDWEIADSNQAIGLEIEWEIFDHNGELEHSTDELKFTHEFTDDGQKEIMMHATNQHGASVDRSVSILVIGDGPGMFAFIKYPKFGQVIPTNELSTNVQFDGTGSYVIDNRFVISSCTGEITCLAGDCPSAGGNIPNGCTEEVDIVGGSKGYSDLEFTWSRISDGDVENILLSGFGSSAGDAYYGSSEYSSRINDKELRLLLKYNEPPINLEQTTSKKFTLGICIQGGEKVITTNDDGIYIGVRDTTNKNSPDFNSGAWQLEGGGECCPVGMRGQDTGCEFPDVDDDNNDDDFEGCARYLSPGACNDAVVRGGIKCDDPIFSIGSSCEWTGSVCSDKEVVIKRIGGDGVSTCIESVTSEESCKDGFRSITVDTIWDDFGNGDNACMGGDECLARRGTFTVPCGRPSFELPFFGLQQLFLSVGLISLIYLALIRTGLIRREED
jgi:hypothetical protein